jgi:ammonium transporter, Amt family
MVTTLSAASGGTVTVLIDRFFSPAKAWDVSAMCNGILAGLVSVTAGCNVIPTWSAVIHGGIGGVVYTFASSRVLKAKIDDPLDAFAVHGACGMWGVIAASLFSSDKYSKGGLFYGDGELFGAALVFLLCVIVWSGSVSFMVRSMPVAYLQ